MYNKGKALQILDDMLKTEDNENVRCAISDLHYAVTLALVAYTEHLMHWSDIPEHSNQETREYFAALHNIHKTLVGAGVFDELDFCLKKSVDVGSEQGYDSFNKANHRNTDHEMQNEHQRTS